MMRLARRLSPFTTGRPGALRPHFFRFIRLLITSILSLLALSAAVRAGTLDAVREAGAVRCGVIENGRGLTEQNATGQWGGCS